MGSNVFCCDLLRFPPFSHIAEAYYHSTSGSSGDSYLVTQRSRLRHTIDAAEWQQPGYRTQQPRGASVYARAFSRVRKPKRLENHIVAIRGAPIQILTDGLLADSGTRRAATVGEGERERTHLLWSCVSFQHRQ